MPSTSIPRCTVHGLEVSSSAIRERVAAGDMTRARWMLGRPFEVRSTQARGRGIGTRLLVPTVNLAPYDGLLPAFGVYVTRLTVAGRSFQAVTNVGNRPTFGEASFAVESHILNFEPVEMDEQTPIELEFLLRLRGESRVALARGAQGADIQGCGQGQALFPAYAGASLEWILRLAGSERSFQSRFNRAHGLGRGRLRRQCRPNQRLGSFGWLHLRLGSGQRRRLGGSNRLRGCDGRAGCFGLRKRLSRGLQH